LATEIPRAKIALRRRIANLVKEQGERLSEWMPGATASERERNSIVIFSAMSGALSVARILTEPADRERVLQDMRDYLLRSF
jgi:hypothetical protein